MFVAGIGMDTCVIPLRHGGLSLVQTTDYIYPIVDDPYMMVRILLCSPKCGPGPRLTRYTNALLPLCITASEDLTHQSFV